eukprot:scaffold11328_cov66-Cyclotella_meneghiniana.AAC.8
MHQQLQDAVSQQASLQRENDSLKKGNKTLTEATEKARADLRAERKLSTVSDKSNKQQIQQLEAMAQQAEVGAADHYQTLLEDERKQHHIEMQQLESTKDKEVVRLQRQIQAAEKKGTAMLDKEKRRHECNVESLKRDASSELKHKDDVIKRLRDISSHNESIALSSLQEQKTLKQKHEKQMTHLMLSASATISQVRKQGAATVNKYATALKESAGLVEGYQQMSEEVAEEYVSLSKTYDAKVPALEATAQKQLKTNKNLKDKVSTLKDELEETREDLQRQLDEARQDISVLQEQLHRKAEECEEYELMAKLAAEDLATFQYHKVKKSGNPKSWDPIVTQLVIEMLAHQTPPSCISANILTALNNTLVNQLEESLASIPSMYRVNMDIVQFYRGVEKMVGGTANYAKGSGKEFVFYTEEFHPTTYLYPLTRACGGTRQDLSVEGAPSILMNLPLYLQFLRWRSGVCGTSGDGILATNLQIYLRSVEMVALLCVMSILHISICMPIRWLAGKTAELSDYDFGHYDMGKALDTLEAAFEAIIEDPSKFLDEDFMMGLFSEISDKVDPFKAYLEYMFEEKLGNVVVNSKDDEDKVLPYDEIRAAVFYPNRKDIIQTDELCRELAVTAATAFLVEFRDESKATSNYLSSIGGKSSLAVLTESQRKSGIGKESSNSTSELLHGTTTDILKRAGTIRLDHAAGDGMIKYNRHVDRDVEQYIKGTKPSAKKGATQSGLFFTLPKELQISAVMAAKRGSKNLKKEHDQALESQKRADLARKQAEQEQIVEKAKEAYIRAWELIEIYRSERGWKTLSQSWRTFNQLSSESARLRAVKQQIVIRWKGFGWDEAAHAWSKDQRPYSSLELMKHFVEVVLPMEKHWVPDKPLLRFQDNTTKYTNWGHDQHLRWSFWIII